MNAFKKHLRAIGIRMASDYECLPFRVSNNVFIDDVIVNAEEATITEVYNVIVVKRRMSSSGELIEITDGDDQPFI